MGRLARFEGRLRGAVEGAFAKTFKEGVEPVEIAGALARELDDRKAVGPSRTLVPNTFVVELSTEDFERLSPYAQPLAAQLAEMVEEHASKQRYAFVGPVTLGFEEAPDITTGLFRVRSDVTEAELPPTPPSPVYQPTTVMRIERPTALQATLLVQVTGQPDETHTISTRTVLIGRGSEADIAISDSSVSRRHGEIAVVDGIHRYTDLGSTNGTSLAGRPISDVDLADGDRLSLGNVTITYRSS